MGNSKKPVFNADAAEEYFSDLLTFYRKTANDIFRRDNEGRQISNQTYSAEYQKWLGMQAAMREVLEYFSKYDLIASIEDILGDYDLDRIRELVKADRDGRCVVIPDVDKRARESMADGLQEVFKEWSYEDSSVGLFGMSDGEKELASALIYALEGEEDRRDG